MKINADNSKFSLGNASSVSRSMKDTSTQPKYRLCLNGFTLVSGAKVLVVVKE